MRVLVTALAAFLLAGLPAEAGCAALERFTLETDWYGGVTVPVSIAGKSVRLLVDTGGASSMLTAGTVDMLGLTPRPLKNVRVTLYGGLELTRFVRTEAMSAGAAEGPTDFYVMPDNRIPYALSGTLAPDFLSRFDVEFDFKNAAMTLYAPGICLDGGVPLTRDSDNHLIVPVEIDGKTLPAMLDTGASRSDMSLETARALFGPDLALEPAARNDAEPGTFTHAFQSLSIAGVKIADPDIVMVPDAIGGRPPGSPRLVLGMGVLRRLHLHISYARQRIAISSAE